MAAHFFKHGFVAHSLKIEALVDYIVNVADLAEIVIKLGDAKPSRLCPRAERMVSNPYLVILVAVEVIFLVHNVLENVVLG